MTALAWLAHGGLFISGSQDGNLRLWDPGQSQCLASMSAPGESIQHVWAFPDGKRVLSVAKRGHRSSCLRIWRLDAGECEVETNLSTGSYQYHTIVVSADAQWCVVGGFARRYCLALDSLAVLREEKGILPPSEVGCEAALSDGQSYLCISKDGGLCRGHIERDEKRTICNIPDMGTNSAWSMAVGGRDRWCAVGCENGTILIVDLQSGQIAWQLRGHTSRVQSLAWSAEGGVLLSSGADKRLVLWTLDYDVQFG